MELKQKNLFEISESNEEKIKTFTTKDVFFNNGMINLYHFTNEYDFDIKIELKQGLLEIKYTNEDVYFDILNKFFKEKKIVTFNEKNKRIFFDTKRNKFIQSSKINIKNGGSNDSKNVLIKQHIDDLKISKEELKRQEDLYKSSYENHSKDEFKIEKCYYDKTKQELYILSTLEEHISKFSSYLVKDDKLIINSSIHNFEDGQKSFHDMIKVSKLYKIDKWDALIYWFGTKIQYYYNFSFFIYPNSSNIEALSIFKENLQIEDERITFRDKDDKLITTSSNIDFFEQLKNDGIFNSHFYISKSELEFELKFFMYLFSKIYHIEDEYKNARARVKKSRQKIYDALQEIRFVVYVEDGTFKKSLNEYTKAHELIKFFEKLKEKDLFAYLSDIIMTFSLSQGQKEVNVNFQKWCKNFLEFKELRRYYYVGSFNILKNNSKPFGKKLFDFEQIYLKTIMKGKDMNIHKKSKKVGESIGYFCAELNDKDLLFKLRNVKNYKQLLSYFKDLKFASLKNESKAKFSKEFNESLEEIIEILESDWEIIRDYIAIYAIDKYKATTYAKTHNN